MQFKQIKLEDKSIIEAHLPKNMPSEHFSCSMCFNTEYIWSKLLNTEYAIENGTLITKIHTPHGEFYRVFGEDFSAIFSEVESPIFYSLNAPSANKLLELRPDYEITPSRDFFDYVYETEKLINLSGKKYHSKKNHFNAFVRENPGYEYKKMDSSLALKCAEIYPDWAAEHKMSEDEYFQAEYDSLMEMLNNFEAFSVNGGVLYDQNKEICAFTVSEQLSHDTALIHFEKAAQDSRGAFAAINKLHLENTYAHLKYVNREDDSGIKGLRKAKESYKPCFMVEKFRAAPTTP